MDGWPEDYKLESVEQLRAAADDLRQRILEELVKRPLTVTQLGEVMKLSPAKVHYHVRELERVGLVKLVETREKSGILEKYYRSVARRFSVPRELLQRSSPEDPVAALQAMMDSSSEAFTRALLRATRLEEGGRNYPLTLARTHLWLTEEQYNALSEELLQVFAKYEGFEQTAEARQYTFVHMAWDTDLSLPDENSTLEDGAQELPDGIPQPGPFNGARVQAGRRTWAVGVMHLNRQDLERTLSEGKQLDITITGMATFADDVTPELAERAIGRFKHRGSLRASPEVLEVLARKEEATTEGSMQ